MQREYILQVDDKPIETIMTAETFDCKDVCADSELLDVPENVRQEMLINLAKCPGITLIDWNDSHFSLNMDDYVAEKYKGFKDLVDSMSKSCTQDLFADSAFRACVFQKFERVFCTPYVASFAYHGFAYQFDDFFVMMHDRMRQKEFYAGGLVYAGDVVPW